MRNSVEIGKELKNIRVQHKYTVQELADKLTINKSTLSRYENGTRKVPMNFLTDFANYFNMSPQELLLKHNEIDEAESTPQNVPATMAAHLSYEGIELTEEQWQKVITYARFIKETEGK
ncbi:helix-turn-helix domain-containing protein [Macrococcus capreoli]|uniref:helix-turn-helix domain-containing protein n=1 Tax=Macrococcus capreoli TaxID=2982690 RepID=UPI003EE4505E